MDRIRPRDLLLVALVLLAPIPAATSQEAVVPVNVRTDPGEATISVDNTYAGLSGADEPIEVSPGRHEILIYKEGFLIELRDVEAEVGKPLDIEVELTPDIAIPHHLSIDRAPEFVKDGGDGVRYVVEILNLITEFHVQAADGGDLMLGAVETLLDALDKIRRREILLRQKYDPEVRERLYSTEVDLTTYPALTTRKTVDGQEVRIEVTAGDARRTIDLDLGRPHRMAFELRSFHTWLGDNWDTRGHVGHDAFWFFAVQGLIGGLGDKFTYFISPRDMDEMKIDTSQKLGGLGMQVSKADDGLEVIAPIEDTPAFEAGIRAGDVIYEVEGKAIRELSLSQAVNLLRGEPGTRVAFTIRRPGVKEPVRLTLTRALIRIKYLKSRMLPDDVGYIRLTSFMGEKVSSDFEAALDDLERQGMKGLVIDLRGNPGGLMTAALEIVDFFADGGMVFEVRARVDDLSEKHYAHADGTHGPYPIVVLINRGSASASEIVAGILRDKGVATLVGEKSFGKGSVQRILPLGGEGSPAVALTIALYYLLGRTKVHEIGVSPDIVVEVDPEIEAKIARTSIYTAEDGIEDPQLEKAIEVISEKLGR